MPNFSETLTSVVLPDSFLLQGMLYVVEGLFGESPFFLKVTFLTFLITADSVTIQYVFSKI